MYNTYGEVAATSKLSGTTTSGADEYQKIPFTTEPVVQPGRYFIGLQQNGATDSFRAIRAGSLQSRVDADEGKFGEIVPIAGNEIFNFNADRGPIANTY